MLPTATGGANWQGGSFDPETQHVLHLLEHQQVVGRPSASRCPRTATRPNAGSPDMRVDVPRARRAQRRTRPARPRRGGGGGRTDVQGLPLVKPPYGRITALDLNKGEIVVADRARRDAGQHPEPPGAERAERSRAPAGRAHRHARHEDAGDRRRGRHLHDARRPARRDAARLRQGDRQGSRRGLHAGAADRLADDLHAERPAVHRRRRSAATEFPGELLAFRLPCEP